MRQIINVLLGFLVFAALLINACTDPTEIGADLLDEDQVDVKFTDTLSIKAKTQRSDSVRTYSPFSSSQLDSYLFGDLKDPVFGNASANIYMQLRLEFANVDFTNSVLDSMVLFLSYDTNGVYGDIAGTFGMDVLQVTEEMPRLDEHYSNTTFSTESIPLTSHDFVPKLDSIEFIDYTGDGPDTVRFPHLRVPIAETPVLREVFFNQDTSYYENDTTFFANSGFHGLNLKPNKETAGLLSFALKRGGSGIYVYYTKDDTLKSQFRFELNDLSTRTVNYNHDYSGSIVESFLENPDLTDTLVFAQSMGGLEVDIEIPNITDLAGIIVNKAELELSVANLEEDPIDIYKPVEQLLVSKRNSDGGLSIIQDILLVNGDNLSGIFGGNLVAGDNGKPDTYTMNISSHIQDMIDGIEPNTLVVTPLGTSQRGNRVVFFGPSHPTNRITLKIAYTKL